MRQILLAGSMGALLLLMLPAMGGAENDDPAKFGVVSPEMRKCFAEANPARECKAKTPDRGAGKGMKLGPLRITGVGHFGIDYDGSRFEPQHGMEIKFEFGGQTDSGLAIVSQVDLPVSNE